MQDFSKYHPSFSEYMGLREAPNAREKQWILRAQKIAGYIARIPGVRMIAVCNSLSMYATWPGSDIDLFIITAPRRMWLVRIGANLIVWALGCRRPNLHKHNGEIAGRICLSFFCTTDALDFSRIALVDDVYLYFWITYLRVIIDRDDTYACFLGENSLHMDRCFDPFLYAKNVQKPFYDGWIFWKWMDIFLGKIFLPRALRSYTQLGCPEGVVIDEHMLKFHDQDRRSQVRDSILT